MTTSLPLADIRIDGGTQSRAGLNQDVVLDYTQAMQADAQFPAVTVYYDGSTYWLADGFHRIAAAKEADLKEFPVEVKQGTLRDAILHSVGANGRHGLRRNNEDKRRAVTILLEDSEWSKWSNREIAERCDVGHALVNDLRRSLDGESSDPTRAYTTKHGTTATMNTANIGHKPTAPVRYSNDPDFNQDAPEAPAIDPDTWYPVNLHERLVYVDPYAENEVLGMYERYQGKDVNPMTGAMILSSADTRKWKYVDALPAPSVDPETGEISPAPEDDPTAAAVPFDKVDHGAWYPINHKAGLIIDLPLQAANRDAAIHQLPLRYSFPKFTVIHGLYLGPAGPLYGKYVWVTPTSVDAEVTPVEITSPPAPLSPNGEGEPDATAQTLWSDIRRGMYYAVSFADKTIYLDPFLSRAECLACYPGCQIMRPSEGSGHPFRFHMGFTFAPPARRAAPPSIGGTVPDASIKQVEQSDPDDPEGEDEAENGDIDETESEDQTSQDDEGTTRSRWEAQGVANHNGVKETLATRRTAQEHLAANPAAPGTFRAILVDPPWQYKTYSEETGQGRSAESHYPTMSIEEMAALPVGDLAATDCALFMWVTWPTIQQAFALGQTWGFEYKTCGFLWAKLNKEKPSFLAASRDENWHMGMGFWSRANTEACLLFTKGEPPRLNADVRQLLVSPLREHSQKPDEIYGRIERLVAGPYLELFARQKREGWSVWGNEVESDIVLGAPVGEVATAI